MSRGFTNVTGDHTSFSTSFTALDPQGQKCLIWYSARTLKSGLFPQSALDQTKSVVVVAHWRHRKALEARYPRMEIWLLDLAKLEDRFVQSPDGTMQILSAPRA